MVLERNGARADVIAAQYCICSIYILLQWAKIDTKHIMLPLDCMRQQCKLDILMSQKIFPDIYYFSLRCKKSSSGSLMHCIALLVNSLHCIEFNITRQKA